MSIEFISINPKIPKILNKVEKQESRWVREKSCETKMGFWDGTLRKGPPLDAVRLTSGQARYRRMGYRLGPLQLKVNPGSGGLAGRSTWSQDAARHDPSQRVPSCDMGSVKTHGESLEI